MPMTVSEAIAARHSVRSYAPRALTEAEIRELLEAGRAAPSSLNSQPWRFKVVTDKADLAWFGTSEATRKQAWLAQAPAIFVCCADLEHYVKDAQAMAFFYRENNLIQGETMDGIEDHVARAAAAEEQAKFGSCAMNTGLAVAFMMLKAVEMGLGTCWVGMFNEARVKERCGIPANYRVVCLLAVGHPDEAATHPKKRKSLDEIRIP